MSTIHSHFRLTNGSWIHASTYKFMHNNNLGYIYVLYKNKAIIGILKEALVEEIRQCTDKPDITHFKDVD